MLVMAEDSLMESVLSSYHGASENQTLVWELRNDGHDSRHHLAGRSLAYSFEGIPSTTEKV